MGHAQVGNTAGAASAARHSAEPHYRRLLEKIPAAAYLCDTDGLITYFNQHALRLWGRAPALNNSADRFCGALRLFAPDGTPVRHDQSWTALALREGQDYNGREIVIERPDGRRVTALVHANPLHDDDGALVGAVNVLIDITAQQQVAEERRRFEAQLLQAQKLESLGIMAGGVAHDFNNLLTAVLGFASLTLAELPPASPASAMVREIEHAAQRAADLARQMMAYSGRSARTHEMLRVDTLVRDMSTLLKTVVSKKAIVRLDLSPVTVEADATQLAQVIMNLVINASEALEGRVGTITVRTRVEDIGEAPPAASPLPQALPARPFAVLEVQDTGSGMSEETRARIFDPFYTTRFTGRGLGLAAVLGIVREHRGAISVTSELGGGSCFRVLLPSHNATSPASGGHATADAEGRSLLLVVEDEETIRTFARRVLERQGFRVLEAADGLEGVRLFKERRDQIAAVVLDLTMPRMDGIEVLRELRRERPEVPVLVMSGYNEEHIAPRIGSAPATAFLQKPFRQPELLAEVLRLLPAAP